MEGSKQHIGVVTAGTRGDVQPAIVLGKALEAAGYSVSLIAGTNFEDWIRSHELDFVDIGLDIDELMATEEARAWKNSRQWTELYYMKRLFQQVTEPLVDRLTEVLPRYEAILTGGTTFPIAAAIASSEEIPLFHLLKQPMYPTKAGRALPMAIRPKANSRLNKLTQPLMLRGFWYAYGAAGMKQAAARLGQAEPSYREFKRAYLDAPTFIAISPPVQPTPDDYPDNVHITGYLFLDEEDRWQPPADLKAFLEDKPAPVYIGFGSMTGRAIKGLVTMLTRALEGRRAVVGGGWSEKDIEGLPESIYLLDGAPHEWLFPRMQALVHHGGSGTSAEGLRAGKPTLVIPHFFDQFYFGRRIQELGAGPKPIPRHSIDAESLKRKLGPLLSDQSFQRQAEAISREIEREESARNVVDLIDRYLGRELS